MYKNGAGPILLYRLYVFFFNLHLNICIKSGSIFFHGFSELKAVSFFVLSLLSHFLKLLISTQRAYSTNKFSSIALGANKQNKKMENSGKINYSGKLIA